jgi:hypothetical protein
MRTLAGRLDWPEGFAEKLIAIEEEYPHWTTWFWREGEGKAVRGCVATLSVGGLGDPTEIVAETPEKLGQLVSVAEEKRLDELSRCPRCHQRIEKA